MKKIFTFVLAAALAMPTFAAQKTAHVDITIKAAEKGASVGTAAVLTPADYLCTYPNQEITYDSETGFYKFVNFLGYNKANFSFKPDATLTAYQGNIPLAVQTTYGAADEPKVWADRTDIAYLSSATGNNVGFYFDPEYFAEKMAQPYGGSTLRNAYMGPNRDRECYASGVCNGATEDYRLFQPRLNMNGTATNYYQSFRTYAVENGDKTTFYISGTTYGRVRKDKASDTWGEYEHWDSGDTSGSSAKVMFFIFEVNNGLEDMGGGSETPEGTAVTVETWDDYKTKKVAEDFTGSLAYNNGEYTLSGIYGAADVDFRFKIGAYNEYTKKYAIEYLNTEEWKGYDFLFLLDKSGAHANIKPTAVSGSDVPEAGINEVLIYNKSLYSYITKENDTYAMRIKYTGTDPDKNDYSSDYLMIFSWKDPEAVEPEVPEGDKVVINTFNSTMTTKVAEPSESALTYADGEYTVSALFGDANVDFKFKVGAYNATSDKYAIEFVNYEDYAGSYGYLLDKNGKHADIKPIATGTSEVLEGGVREVLMYTKSTSSYIKKDNDTYTMYLKYSGYKGASGYGYTNDYYMVFSWVDPNAGVDGIEIDNENAPVEYYNLQGVKVENPAAGIYIRRHGKSVEKVVIK